MHELRAEDLSFLESAPVRLDFDAPVPASPEAVFAAISADPSTWSWFPGLGEGRYESDPPHGVGTRRSIRMGDDLYRETILAWDEPRRWAYRVDETAASGFRAIVEDWQVEADGDNARVRWRFAVDPGPEMAPAMEQARAVIAEVFDSAMTNLAVHLAEG
jgi:hypothetical protein